MTAGMKSSEFYVTLALLGTAIVMVAMGEREYAGWALVAAGLGAGGYAIGRGTAKGGGQ